MKRRSFIAAIAAVPGAGISVPALAQKKRAEVRVPFLQYPLGGGWEGYIIFDRYVAERHPWLRPVQQETAGYVFNLQVMSRDKKLQRTATFGTTTLAIHLAETGYQPYFTKPLSADDFRHLYGEYMLGQSWFVTLDPKIKTVEDLRGRSIGIGLKTQTHWGGAVDFMLRHGYGITSDNTKINHLGPVRALDALLDGQTAAGLLSVNTEVNQKLFMVGPTVTRIAAVGKTYHMIPWPRDVVNKVALKTGFPIYAVTIPAKTLPNQPEPFEIYADIGTRSVHKDFPDELAYELTKAFIEIGPKAGAFSALGQLWTREMMVSPFSFDWKHRDKIHPGAQRAFVEAGMWPPEKIWKPIPIGR
jgi:TRAP-type uncharacterized transport system substrate-binding protein